jgi:EmrB/QacA subfamily drug resistance transporter
MTSETPSLPGKVLWAILGLVLLADALDMIDSTVTNIAAPTIVADIGGGDALVKWLGSAYALALGVLLVVGGRLGDRYGQRRLFLVGMAGFTAASALAGTAWSPAVLIGARAVQGAFGALLIPQGMAIMTKHFPREMQQRAFGLFGPLLGIATVGGPILAGFLIDADLLGLAWRPIFLINVVLGSAGIALAARILPHDDLDAAAPVRIDGLGSGLLAAAMFGLIFGLIEGSTEGWGFAPIACLVGGLGFLGAFAWRQRTAAEPLIRPSLLANRGFSSGLVTGLVFFASSSGLAYIISLFMQQALGAKPSDAALGLLPMTLGIIVAAGFTMAGPGGRMGRTLIAIGMCITLAGAGGLLAVVETSGLDTTLWGLAPFVFVIGLGLGACYGTLFDIALGDVAPDEAGGASGSLSAVQQLAAGIGSAVVTSVYLHGADQVNAMATALIVVIAATAACLPAVRLLPKHGQPEAGHGAPVAA